MPEVNVEIDGKKYRMACEEGQERHLFELADRFNRTVMTLKGSFGEIGDNRLVVMAGIAVLDELAEAENRIESLKQDKEKDRSSTIRALEATLERHQTDAERRLQKQEFDSEIAIKRRLAAGASSGPAPPPGDPPLRGPGLPPPRARRVP